MGWPDLLPTGLAFGFVQILLWMIQLDNNHSVVQCNVSPVKGFIRHRYIQYEPEPIQDGTWH